jgi:hypothetical protein
MARRWGDEQGCGVGNDFDADGELAEDFSVGFGGNARAKAVGRAAIDRVCADEMDVAGEGMAAEKNGHEKAEVIEAAARVEGDEMKAVAVEGGSRSEVAEQATKVAHADGEELGDLLDVGHSRSVGEGGLKEWEGVGGPKAEVGGEGVGGSERQDAERDVSADQSLENLIDSAIAAAGNDAIEVIADCLAGQCDGRAWAVGFKGFNVSPSISKHRERLLDGSTAARRADAGSGVVG